MSTEIKQDEGNPIARRWATDGDSWRFSLCGVCRHKTPREATCVAFPGGIPATFLSGQADHVERSWDEPVTFEYYADEVPEEVAARLR